MDGMLGSRAVSATGGRADGHWPSHAVGIENRDGERKCRVRASFALHPDAPAMDFDDMFGDGEAQAGTPEFARARGVHAVEALENARLLGSGDADTGVGHSEHDVCISDF